MTKFTDGPAAGVVLALKRTPQFLRVVRDWKGTWDALDQLSDKPHPKEAVHAYRLVESHGHMHLYGKNICGWFAVASYAVVDPQPEEKVMRSTDAWRAWAMEHAEKVK